MTTRARYFMNIIYIYIILDNCFQTATSVFQLIDQTYNDNNNNKLAVSYCSFNETGKKEDLQRTYYFIIIKQSKP